MSPKAKKVLWWTLGIFVLYAVFRSPEQVADLLRTIWDIILTALQSIGRFFDLLLGPKK